LELAEELGDLSKLEILYNTSMAKSKEPVKTDLKSLPKLPSLNFGKRGPVLPGQINSGLSPKSFIPPPVRVTQNKGSGGK